MVVNSLWTHDVSRTASNEITLVRLSARPSLRFVKIGSLFFSDIVHDDSWPWYLVPDEARFFGEKKRNWWPNLVKWTKIGPETKFYFAIFSSLQGVSQALFDDVYVIFPIHVNFSITSRCVLKATVHRKKQ